MRRWVAGALLVGVLAFSPVLHVHAASDDAAPPPSLDAVFAALDLSDDDAVLTELEALVDEGNAYAPQILGAMYQYGIGVAKDRCRAFELYRLAAARGNARANADVGKFHEDGDCVTRDFDLARKHYEIAIAGGDGEARLKLAFLYLQDEWPLRDERHAFRLARESYMRAPTMRARSPIGSMFAVFYERGQGVEVDLDRAEDLRRATAEFGDPLFQILLAWSLGKRYGSRERRDEIMMWLVLSALQHHVVGSEVVEVMLPLVADEDEFEAVRAKAEAAARAKFEQIADNPASLIAEAATWCLEHHAGSSDCRWYGVVHDAQCGLGLDDVYQRRGFDRTRFYHWCRVQALANVEAAAVP